ncbi:MAG: hypothetical protein HY331_10525 [Chloroflexi bacterium]|nr:hypothetical protein [Chloroflexota bacterium]
MQIRRAEEADAPAIAGLHAKAWQRAYRGQVPDAYLSNFGRPEFVEARTAWWRTMLAEPPPEWRTWIVVSPDRIVGFATTGPSRDADALPGLAEVWGIYLLTNSPRRLDCPR